MTYVIVQEATRGFLPAQSKKSDPLKVEWEERAKRLLKAQLQLHGITYAQLAALLAGIGITETERNLRNKISRGGFSAAFLLQCLSVAGATSIHLD